MRHMTYACCNRKLAKVEGKGRRLHQLGSNLIYVPMSSSTSRCPQIRSKNSSNWFVILSTGGAKSDAYASGFFVAYFSKRSAIRVQQGEQKFATSVAGFFVAYFSN